MQRLPVAGFGLALALTVMAGAWFAAPPAADAQLNTWTIVTADPATGDVGIAGASCVPVNIDAVVALAPGLGVVTTQAAYNIENREKARFALERGASADEVITAALDMDDNQEDRQYGVVTLDNGAVEVAAYTGVEVGGWAGAITDTQAAVSVQGNVLEGEAVVRDAYNAFTDPATGELALSDRLLRALEAGSAAGGDMRCNQQGVEQTAAAAFIMVARGGDAPYSVPSFGLTATNDPNKPWLALSVSEPTLGPNPIPELRRQYDAWRAANLPACAGCDLSPYAELPPGADADAGRSLIAYFNTYVAPMALRFGGLVAVALFWIVLILYFRRKGKL